MSTSPPNPGRVRITLDDDGLVVELLDLDGVPAVHHLDIGMRRLVSILGSDDPPPPDLLTNAIGAVADHLDDLVRIHDHLLGLEVDLVGADAAVFATVEVGHIPTWPHRLSRADAEEVFRAIATETRSDRRHNPGLPADAVDRVVAAGCAAVALMRRLHCTTITVSPGANASPDDPVS